MFKNKKFLFVESILFIILVIFALRIGLQETFASLNQLNFGVSPWGKLDVTSDGTTVYAIREGGGGFGIEKSSDSGSSSQSTGESREWVDIYEAGGNFIAVSNSNGDYVYTSIAGGNWQPDLSITPAPRGPYKAAAITDSGDMVVLTNSAIYINDTGSWTEIGVVSGESWQDVAISSDGVYTLLAGYGASSGLLISSDMGANRTDLSLGENWYKVAMSDSGQYMVAVESASGNAVFSSDYGVSWATLQGKTNITGIDVSNNGKIVVTINGGGMYYTVDYSELHANWITIDNTSRSWADVKVNDQGTKIYGAVNNDYIYSYDVDVTPPSLSNGSPSGTLTPEQTAGAVLSVDTNEDATCRYSTVEGTSYDDMVDSFDTTGGTTSTEPLPSVNEGSYTYYVRCLDEFGNKNASDYEINFSIEVASDTTPPVVSGAAPSGSLIEGATSATLQVTTNENATCKYSLSSENYEAMTNVFSTTGSTSHSSNITGLDTGTSYTYYVRCIDESNNANVADTVISFSTVSIVYATITNITSDKANATYGSGEVIDIDLTFSESINSSGITLNLNSGGSCNTGPIATSTSATCNYTVALGQQAGDLSVSGITGQVTDLNGFSNSNDAILNDSVNNLDYNKDIVIEAIAPIISDGSPDGALSSGTSSTTIEVLTDEVATCKYDTISRSYDLMSNTFDTTAGTSHSQVISGLSDGSSYTYYVRCEDEYGNKNQSSYSISFDVESADSDAPVVSNATPSGTLTAGTTSVTLEVDTDENATCKYGTVADTAFDSISNTFSTTGTTAHSQLITGLTSGTYTYYVRCSDESDNANDEDTEISFTISENTDESDQEPEEGSSRKKGSVIQNVSNTFTSAVSRSVNRISDLFTDLTLTIQNDPKNETKIEGLIEKLKREFLKLLESGEAGMTPLNQNPSQTFTMDLEIGDSNEQVRLLQVFLNKKGYIVAENGPGSIGNETTIFGAATQAALVRFQKDNNIVPAVGYFGPITRNFINNLN